MKYTMPVYALRLVKDRTAHYAVASVDNEAHAASALRALIGACDREHLACLFLNRQNKIAGAHVIAIGGLGSAAASQREIFKAAIVANAAAIVLGHNHPGGDPAPSASDLEFTRKALAASALIGIPILDHLILTIETHHSMLRHGQIPDLAP